MSTIIYRLIMIFGPLIILTTTATNENSLGAILVSIGVPALLVFAAPFVLSVMGIRRGIVYNRNIPKRTHHDVTHEQRPIPEKLHPFLPVLEQLDFKYIGQVERRIPSEANLTRFVFLQPDGLIHLEIMVFPKSATAAFSTTFADHAILETMFPSGYHVSLPYFRLVRVRSKRGLMGAYQTHRQVASEMAAQHGPAIAFYSLKEILDWTEYVERHYAKSIETAANRRGMWLLIPNIYVGIWILLLFALLLVLGGYQPIIGIAMGLLLIPSPILLVIAAYIDR